MLEIDWEKSKGWTAPRIVPYHNLSISPAASSLHYALQCFEGMKAYLDDSNRIRLFRPERNMARLNDSMQRLDFPGFDGEQLINCLKKLCIIDKDWIPKGFGYSLYIRPTAISTYGALGVAAAPQVKLYVITSPVGPYYPSGFKPVKLLADPKYVRAWPGGTGGSKVGSNYGPTIRPQREAAAKGFAQILWLFGPNYEVTEVGTMNQFFFWRTPTGKKELITTPLDGTILPGVTRDSVLSLARGWKEFDVVERPYTISEVIKAAEEGRLLEAFGAGTAAIVSPVEGFSFRDKYYQCPIDPKLGCGPLAKRLVDTLMNIQYGKVPHNWSVVVD